MLGSPRKTSGTAILDPPVSVPRDLLQTGLRRGKIGLAGTTQVLLNSAAFVVRSGAKAWIGSAMQNADGYP
jgi:hypothetical protein